MYGRMRRTATGTRWWRARPGRRRPCPACVVQLDSRRRSLSHRVDPAVLVDRARRALGGVGQAPGELGRVHHHGVVGSTDRRGRSASRPRPAPASRSRNSPPSARRPPRAARRPGRPRSRRSSCPVGLEVAVDAVALDVVLAARAGSRSPSRSSVSNSSGKRSQAVRRAVGEARLAEAAVAARCRPADPLGLEQHDVAVGVALLGEQRGPEPGVAAADDGRSAVA